MATFKVYDGTNWIDIGLAFKEDLNAYSRKENGIYYVEGTGTTDGVWKGENSDITKYYDGLTIAYKINVKGASTTTLQIGNLAPVTVRLGTGNLTTHYPVNTIIYLTYTTISGTGYWVTTDYDSTNTYQLRKYYGGHTASTAIYRYQLLLTQKDSKILPINVVNNAPTNTSKTLTTESFDPFGEIYFYSSTTTVSAGALPTISSLYKQVLADLRYSFNTGSTLTANKPVYMVCVLQSDGLFKLNGNSCITQSLPTSADTKYYIYLGQAHDTYRIELSLEHPIYYYDGTKLSLYTGIKQSDYAKVTDLDSYVEGLSSSTDNAIVRFDGTGGKTIQNSTVTIDDTGNMVFPNNGTIKLDTYGTRKLTLTGNSITADMSNETGGWAGAFASVKHKDSTSTASDGKTTTTMLGWYGSATDLTHIFMGGTYNSPYMKMVKSGDFTFYKNLTVSGSILQFNKLNLPTASNGTTYGLGKNGQVLKSNGATVYWSDIDSYGISIEESGFDWNNETTVGDAINANSTKINEILNDYISTTKIGVANGIAPLNGSGKISTSYLPDSILGQVSYMGLFDASTSKATLSAGTIAQGEAIRTLPTLSQIRVGNLDTSTYYVPITGDYFIVNKAGTFDSIELEVGDWLIFNGASSGWGKVDNTDAVSSVAGYTGVVTATQLSNSLGIGTINTNISTLQGYFTDGKANTAASADQAEHDADGNVISETYANKKNGIYYTQGASTDTTTSWTGVLFGVDTAYAGLTIAFKTSKASASGLKLTLYKDSAKTQQLVSASVYRNDTAITGHIVANSVVILVYDGSVWRWTDYDANSYAYVRQYTTTTNAEYPLLFAYETTLPSSYDTKYTRKATGFTFNPSTKTLSVDNISIETLYATGKIETESTIFAEGDITSESNIHASSGTVYCNELSSNTMYVGENDDLAYDGTNFTLNNNVIYHAGNLDVNNLAKLDTANTFTKGQKITRADSGAILELESAASDTNFLLKRTSGATCVLEAGSGVGLFGTKSNHSLQIRTNYVNRMTFDTSGGVTLATDVSATSNSNQLATTKWVKSLGYITEDDIPSSLPASDVSAWAKASTKPTYEAYEITGEWNIDGGTEDNVDDAITALIGMISGLSSTKTTTVVYNTGTQITTPAQGAVTSETITLTDSVKAGDRLKVYINGGATAPQFQSGIIEFELCNSTGNYTNVSGSGSFMSNTGSQAIIVSAQVAAINASTTTAMKISVYGITTSAASSGSNVYVYKVERIR